jgi:hypothetical protein
MVFLVWEVSRPPYHIPQFEGVAIPLSSGGGNSGASINQSIARLKDFRDGLKAGQIDLWAKKIVAKSKPPPIMDGKKSGSWNSLLKDRSGGALVEQSVRLELGAKYGALFSELKLAPAMESKLRDELASLEMAKMDFQSASKLQGQKDQLSEAYSAATSDIEAEMKASLGTDVVESVRNYLQTYSVRQDLNAAIADLRSSSEPLSDDTAEKISSVWLGQTSTGPSGGPLLPLFADQAPVSFADIAPKLSAILTPTQLQRIGAYLGAPR